MNQKPLQIISILLLITFLTASGAAISARALVHLLVGHVDHHMESLNEKYLPKLN